MSRLDKEWAIAEIDQFLLATDRVAAEPRPGVTYLGSVQRGTQRDAVARAHIVEQILDRTIPGWPHQPAVAQRRKWTHLREWAGRARVELEREEELREKLGDDAPEMDAGRLHPWVWESAAPLWRTNHFSQAVTQASIRLNAETQAKLGRRDVAETALFNQAFSLSDPTPETPRLRLMKNDSSRTYDSIHRGARSLAEGLYAGVRNPASHEVLGELDEQQALEQLAAFSLLARWVDAATVERG